MVSQSPTEATDQAIMEQRCSSAAWQSISPECYKEANRPYQGFTHAISLKCFWANETRPILSSLRPQPL